MATKDMSFSDKDFGHRLNRMEATLKNVEASVQKIQACVTENKEPTVGRKDPKLGFLRGVFNIDKLPQSEDSLLKFVDPSVKVAWGPRYLRIHKEEYDDLVLGVYLTFEPASNSLSYDTDYTFRLVGSAKNIEYEGNCCFADYKFDYGYSDLIAWTRLTNFTNGFVDEKGNFEVQAIFSVMGKTNTNVLLDAQFLTSGFVKSDCILLVENRRFPVNKALLSLFSDYFKTLFFGDFRETNQDEVELKDVCAAEFLRLLEAIYPSADIVAKNQNLMRDNVECLLRLADCYQVDIVTKQCEVYLKKCPVSEVALEDQIIYAQDYQLPELLDQCIEAFKTVDDMKKLRQSSQYSRLTWKNKLLIYENII